jgi:hypothetical protein
VCLLIVAAIAAGLARQSPKRPGTATAAVGTTSTLAAAPTAITATAPTPATPSTNPPPTVVAAVTTVAPPPGPQPGLVLQTGARGLKVLVPSGWTAQIIDGVLGTSTWADPNDPNAKIVGSTGTDIGGWYQTDGVNYSINPRRYFQSDANVVRYNYSQFGYAETLPGAPYPAYGVWAALLAPDRTPTFYRQVQVQLPPAMKAVATKILADFLRDTKSA